MYVPLSKHPDRIGAHRNPPAATTSEAVHAKSGPPQAKPKRRGRMMGVVGLPSGRYHCSEVNTCTFSLAQNPSMLFECSYRTRQCSATTSPRRVRTFQQASGSTTDQEQDTPTATISEVVHTKQDPRAGRQPQDPTSTAVLQDNSARTPSNHEACTLRPSQQHPDRIDTTARIHQLPQLRSTLSTPTRDLPLCSR